MIISTPTDLPRFEDLLEWLGIYYQKSSLMPSRTDLQPLGLIRGDDLRKILGDMLPSLSKMLQKCCKLEEKGATVFGSTAC